MADKTVAQIKKFIEEEIAELRVALDFVNAEISSGTKTQFNRVYTRKQTEYSNQLAQCEDILNFITGKTEQEES